MNDNITTQSMLPVGTHLQNGKYRIERYLSSGGFGNTYVATNLLFEEQVAVKEFYMRGVTERDEDSVTVSVSNECNLIQFSEQKTKFMKEARRLRRLHNEHIVTVHDLFEENGTAYYVMDYIDGESLSSRLKRTEQPLSEQKALDILSQVLEALKVVHEQGLYHLDIKPANIMVNQSGNTILIDFGASKQMKQEGGATTSTSLSYTPGYAPLEQIAQNLSQFGPWTDLYSLGATLYYILTLNPLPSPTELLSNNNALSMNDSISFKTQQLVRYMMTPLSAKRPQCADDVLNLLNGRGMKANTSFETEDTEEIKPLDIKERQDNTDNFIPGSVLTEPTRKKKSKHFWGVISACCAAILAFVLFFFIIKPSKSPEEIFILAKGYAANNDSVHAIKLYIEAAEMGYAEAQASLGGCFDKGKWVAQDYTKAVYWYRKAAEQGNAEALSRLGLCYYYGKGVGKDYSQAVYWFRKAAEQGEAKAQFDLGCCYDNGQGVGKDYSQAVYWYRKAAEQGDVKAQYSLGLCYYYGEGVSKDYSQAVYWYRKAAEQGDAGAQNNLGECYYDGTGITKDYSQAVYWYRKAAEQGLSEAQYSLGWCYYYGEGVTKDTSLAKSWWEKAAEQGNEGAKKELKNHF